MMIVDDHSRFAWPYFLKKTFTSQLFPVVFLSDIREQGNSCAVENLRSNNGTKFTKQEFVTLRDRHHITRTHSRVFPGAQRRGRALQGDDAEVFGWLMRPWCASAADGASLGGGMRLRLRFPQHDGLGGGQAVQATSGEVSK